MALWELFFLSDSVQVCLDPLIHSLRVGQELVLGHLLDSKGDRITSMEYRLQKGEACFWKLHENRLAESDGAGIEGEEKQQAKVEQASHSSRRREMYRGGTGGNRGRAPGSSARAGRREASEEPRDSAEDSHERAQIWAPLSKEGDRRWQAGEDPPPKRQFTQRTFHKETSALHEWRLASVEGCTAGGSKAGGAAERAAATGRAKVHYCQEGSQQFELHWLALPDLPDGLLTRRHVHTLRLTGHAFRGMGAKAF